MDKAITEKRGIWILLVIATVIVFIGLVWLIVRFLPLSFSLAPESSPTGDSARLLVNCTSPVGYWEEHTELYPSQLVISGQVFKANQLKQVLAGQNGDLAGRLQAQLTAAYLNISMGANQSYIEATIFEAYRWLVDHQAGSEISADDEAAGTRLYNLLDAYNQGLTGVAPCEPSSMANTAGPASASQTATITPSFTPSPTASPTPSETPTATIAYETVSPPTRTPTPTKESTRPPAPTSQPSSTASPFVPPTNTPQPPTPTKTTPPPAATFTQPPLPSATFTPPPPAD